MSSNEEDYHDGENSGLLHNLKKRRIQRACDICRRKKIRCDGVQMPGNRCSSCVAYNYECTYIEAAKKRGPPKGYVESLENRLEKLENLLRRLCPDAKLLQELNDNLEKDNWTADKNSQLSPLMSAASCTHLTQKNPVDIATSVIRGVGSPVEHQDDLFQDDDLAHLMIADNLKRLHIEPEDYRFFGKSSGAMLIQTAIELKNEYTGNRHVDLKRPAMLGAKRPEFWTIRSWERASDEGQKPNYQFPEDDLIVLLTDLYFVHFNLYLPLLHRPTFEKSIAEGLHYTNDMFGANVLLVCAVASRMTDDPRVLLDGVESRHSSGWKWFNQVQMVKKSLLSPPSLYDLQFYCLSVQFLQGCSAPQSCWTMVGIGIRLAQDVGAHRRKVQNHTLTPEDELWKRAFWVLVCMDRMVSAALGRPCAIQDEDYDLDYPIECDDKYWDHPDPEKRFKQPSGKPSLITSFVLYLKLNQVLAFLLRTIYSINKSKILLGFVGQQWEQHIVAELDSALNKWVDSVPDHLRWDPNREDDNFFNQSVVLYAAYYHIQILIHRPFIPSPSKPSPLSFPSLAICTNAARSCSHVVDIQQKRQLSVSLPNTQMAVFTAGIVLLLSIWGGKRSGLSTDPNKEMADVYKCMQVLRTSEGRWHSAGRLWDILYELATVGDLPLPQSTPPSTNKRERDTDSPISTTSASDVLQSSIYSDGPRNIAGSRRVNKDNVHPISLSSKYPSQSVTQPLLGHTLPTPSVKAELPPPSAHPETITFPSNVQQHLYTLPVYSNELGRLPLHGQVKFSTQGQSPAENEINPAYWYPPLTSGVPNPMPIAESSNSTTHNRLSDGYGNETNSISPGFSGMLYDQMGGYNSNLFPSSSSTYGGRDSANSLAVSGLEHQQMRFMAPNSQQMYVDSDTIAMWSTAPTGFELDEWGTYLSNVSELTQGHPVDPGAMDSLQGHVERPI